MKKTFKLLLQVTLGSSVFYLSSCSDESGNDPEPETAEITCYITEEKQLSDGDLTTIAYTYNSDNQVISSTETEDGESYTNTYEYSGGRLSLVAGDNSEATFIYPAASNLPERINISEDGIASEFIIIEADGTSITKVENHEYDDNNDAVLVDVTNFTYAADGSLMSSTTQEYDSETEEFTTTINIQNIVMDGKKNPYNGNVAYMFSNEFNPIAIASSNIVSGSLVTPAGNFPYTSVYEYNENDYPTKATVSVLGFVTVADFIFDCK